MTLNEYQYLASRTMDPSLTDQETEMHALHGMAGELGELHSIYQKVYQGHEPDSLHKMKEVGDLLWFIAEYCTAHDWPLEIVAEMNIEKLRDRYPNGFDTERSMHRRQGDI